MSIEENAVAWDMYNHVTFNDKQKIKADKTFQPYSFERLIFTFSREEIFSIIYFAAHHKILAQDAMRYKLLCHHCGDKLPIFGTNVCSIACSCSGKCMFGLQCKLCHGRSVVAGTKSTAKKATILTDMIIDHRERELKKYL